MTFPPPPQTGRQPIRLTEDEIRASLRKRHSQDKLDYFATDPNPDVRTLGLLALRRHDINDYFALGDLCGKRTVTDDGRLLVFYVGKTLMAYNRALQNAGNDIDKLQARRIIDDYVRWVMLIARQSPSRRNLAAALWAASEGDAKASVDEDMLLELLDLYRVGNPFSTSTTLDKTRIALTVTSDREEDGSTSTAGDNEAQANPPDSYDSALVSSRSDSMATVADQLPMDDLALSPSPDAYALPSEDRLEPTVLESLASIERDASGIWSVPGQRMERESEDEFRISDLIDDRYEVADIRRGGMGVVYLCYDHEQREPVAIKTFQSRFLENERAVARFTQEALTWIRLEKHRHIVHANLVRNIKNRPHIILEHISGPEGLGPDLRSWIDHNRLDLPQSIEFGLHIVLGMQHATRKVEGLVHRDLKPANILVTHDAIAKVTDFGLVRSLELEDIPLADMTADGKRISSGDRLTRVGAVVGTAPYMSPEQCLSQDVDMRSDIYAFGCLLYEMLTGRHIFEVKKFEAWRKAHINDTPKFDKPHAERIPAELRQLVLSCLEKDPRNRPATWGDLVDALAGMYEQVTGEPAVLEVTGPELEARELMDKGYSLTELGRLEEALEAYDRAIELQSDYSWAWARKGRTLRLLARYEEALKCYNKALEIQPRYAFAWNGKGIVLERMGKQEQALACYETAASINPHEVWYWCNQADALLNMGRQTEAIKPLERALEIDPMHPNSWAKLGQVHRLLHNYNEAIVAYEKAIRLNPTYAWAHNGCGLALKAVGRLNDALLSFRRATRHQPDEVWHWYNVTEVLVELGQYQDAVQPARQATIADPTHAESWAKLGQVYRYVQRYDEAVNAYNQAIALRPSYTWAINGKGMALERLQRYEEALAAYQQASQYSDSNDIWHLYNLGNLLVILKRYKEAVSYLERVTYANPKHARSWARLGNAFRNLKRYDEALQSCKQATRLEPNYDWAWNEQGMTLEEMKEYEKALEAYNRASLVAPDNHNYLYKQAEMLFELERYQPALELLDQSLRLDNRSARAWAKKGQISRRLGRMEEALLAYNRAVELDPQYAWAWNGLGLTLSVLKRHDEALNAFREAIKCDQQDAWYWYNQGDELITLNRFQEALEPLEQAIRLNSRHPESWAKRGQALRRLNRHQEAVTAYDQALNLNKEYAWAWNGRGLALQTLERREEALASFERALQLESHIVWYHTNYIDLLLEMQRKKEALIAVDRALQVAPENPTIWARRGQILRRLSEHESAIDSYQKALELDDTYAWAWNGQGLSFAALDRWEQALSCYELAVHYNDRDVWFWHNYGEALLRVGDYQKATDAFHRALEIDPNHEQSQQKLQEAQSKLADDDTRKDDTQ
jgi:tetratricopeptide (TPR) repeat protein